MTPRPNFQNLDPLRRLPLPAILQACDCAPDRRDRSKWHGPTGVLSITGLKFINWTTGQGGGGSIDLVMHLRHLSFPQALRWLNQHFPTAAAPQDPIPAAPSSAPLRLPPPCAANLHRIKYYLIAQRALPPHQVDGLIHSGCLYADGRANAVFLLRAKEKTPVGAELRGTSTIPWRGLAPGSRKDHGFFSIGSAHPQLIVLCESAIDAISASVLFPQALCLSTAGARSNPLWLPRLLQDGQLFYCGFDADPAGDFHAQAMISLYPQIKRLRPPAHDWNDVLKTQA